jgi:hypothetical protein
MIESMDTKAIFACLFLAVVTTSAASGQSPMLTRDVTFPVAEVPFGPGEKMVFKVTWGFLGGVGESTLEIPRIDTVRGHPTYHSVFKLKGGIPLAKVDDTFQSWLDVGRLISRRFDQKQHEANYKRHRIIEFYPEEMRYEQLDKNEKGPLPTDVPLDDVSFLYFVRTLPLEVGKTYTFYRSFKDDGNPVTLKVLRRERVKVEAGEFDTIVVQPIIKTKGLFSEGGKAEVFFSDDEHRMIVKLNTKLSVGTLGLQLKSFTKGTRLTSSGFAPAEAVR